MPPTAPLIKGFLPVRLKLSKDDETFFYVKEHQSGKNNHNDEDEEENMAGQNHGRTLFVCNAPIVPGVSTKLALRSLLGRYADISRVTVVPNPRIRRRPDESSSNYEQFTVDQLALWSEKLTMPTFLPPIFHEGKYAHVVFASPKGLKKTMQELHRVMSATSSKTKKKKSPKKQQNDSDDDNDNESDAEEEESLPGLTMDPLEIQTLADETWAQYERDERKRLGKEPLENADDEEDDDDFKGYDEDGNPSKKTKNKKKTESNREVPTKGALAVTKRYFQSRNALSRAELLAECNRVMGEYEKAEAAKRKAHQQAKDGNMVDEDGFITVSYSANTATGAAEAGIHSLLEESITTTTTSHSRRGAAPRRRNNGSKKQKGSSELQDFYRFQRKENSKRTLGQLRTQFEEDLRKIKKMKEEHQYRPFGK